ncbi:MAG: hypothetical protein AAGF07_00180 [Patescibacteria group bacterium]
MFDFFHKNKNKNTTTVNPSQYANQQAQIQDSSQTQPTPQSYSQAPYKQLPNLPVTPPASNPNTIQTPYQNNFQAKVNTQAAKVDPNSSLTSTDNSQSVHAAAENIEKIFNDQEIQTLQFVNHLVLAITGYSPFDIDISERESVVNNCVQIFSDYLTKYVELRYGTQDATRLKASQKFSDTNVFSKFAELGPKFDEAYNSFMTLVEQQPI